MVLFKYFHKFKWGIGACMWYEPSDGDSLALYMEPTQESSAMFHLSMALHFIEIGVELLFMDLLSPCIVWIPASAGPCCFIPLHEAGSSSCQGCNQTEDPWDVFCRLVQKSNLSHWRHYRSLWGGHDISLVLGRSLWMGKEILNLDSCFVICIWSICLVFEVNCSRLKCLINKSTPSTGH